MQIKSCVNSLPTPLCSRTLLPNLASSILSGWHQRREIVVGDVDSVCAPAAGAGQMAALCARFQSTMPLPPAISHWAVLYCALCSPRRKVSPGWKACAGRCAPRHRAPRRDKQGTGCPLIVSQQMLLGITPRTIFRQPHSTVEKCDIGRTLGAINPSSSRGQLAFWSFSNSNPCRQNFC